MIISHAELEAIKKAEYTRGYDDGLGRAVLNRMTGKNFMEEKEKEKIEQIRLAYEQMNQMKQVEKMKQETMRAYSVAYSGTNGH